MEKKQILQSLFSKKDIQKSVSIIKPSRLKTNISHLSKDLQTQIHKYLQCIKQQSKSLMNIKIKSIEHLVLLSKIELSDILILDLSNNKLTKLDMLRQSKITQVRQLYLIFFKQDNNLISNVQPLTKCGFVSLLKLKLSNNRIWQITPLNHQSFQNITSLQLDKNQIKSLKQLSSSSLSLLKILDLSENPIQQIAVFQKLQIKNLTHFYFHGTSIVSLKQFVLNELIFNSLILLLLMKNQFLDLSSLKNGKFTKLLNLGLSNCNLVDIDCLMTIHMPNLIFLDLNCNRIQNIECLIYCQLPELQTLYLGKQNNIQKII